MLTLQSRCALVLAALLSATTLVLLVPGAMLAQTTSFGVDSYIPERFVDIRWRLHSGYSFGGWDEERDRVYIPFSRYKIDESSYGFDSQNINGGSFFRYRYETVPRYLDLQLDVSAGFSRNTWESSSTEEDTSGRSRQSRCEDDEDKRYRLDIYPSVDAGVYLFDDFFLSMVGAAGFNYTDRPTDDYSETYQYKEATSDNFVNVWRIEEMRDGTGYDKSYGVVASLLPGWGRVYEGEYASTALYLVDELKRNHLLAHEPSPDQMRELSAIIHRYRLKHAVDSRLHKIEAKETIVEYLSSENLMVGPDPLAALLIEDVWSHFPRFDRKFGFRVGVGFGLERDYGRGRMTYTHRDYVINTRYHEDTLTVIDTLGLYADTSRKTTHFENTVTLPHVLVSVDYHRPFTHRWQLDLLARMRYYFDATHERTSQTDEHNASEEIAYESHDVAFEDFYEADCSGTLRYILNSRTDLSLFGYLGYNHVDREVTSLSRSNSSTNRVTYKGASFDDWYYSLGLMGTYRISIPTTLTIRASYSSGVDLQLRSLHLPWIKMLYYPFGSDVESITAHNAVYDSEEYRLSATISHYLF